MKSLVEEASSISKAIEKAWIRAGKPTSFSVKIYEEAHSGFLGFNSKPAKIGLFFEETTYSKNNHEGRKKYHTSSYQGEDNERITKNAPKSENTQENPHRSRSAHNGEGKKHHHEGQRPPSNRHRRPHSFDRKDQDRPERNDQRHDRKKHAASFERKEHHPHSTPKPVEDTSLKTPVAPTPAAPAQPTSTRRVLKVSSRRYNAPKPDADVQTSILPSDNNSTK